MARIFTTKFNFNHKLYDAIITLIDTGGKTSVTVRLLDAELHELIPNGHLNFEGIDGFKNGDTTDNHLAQSLMKCIGASIEHHLVSTP